MLIKKINRKIKPFSHFIWLILLILIVSFATYFFDNNKKKQSEIFKKTLDNIYLQKTFTKITSGLESRFINIDYKAKQGDTYENIINGMQTVGHYNISWDATSYPTGVYFIRFISKEKTKTMKVMLIK